MHPYEMAQTLRQRAKHESVRLNYGSLYAVVEGTRTEELIVARETVREGNRPDRTIYEITEDGSREMVDWLTDMIGVPAKEYPQFLAGLSFIAALTPRTRWRRLQLRTAYASSSSWPRSAATTWPAAKPGCPGSSCVETEFEEQLIETELHFVSGLIKDMRAGDLEGLDTWKRLPHRGKNPAAEGVIFNWDPT